MQSLLLLVSLEFLDVALEILVLILRELQFGLGLEGHVLDLSLVGLVLLFDLVDLVLRVDIYLIERLLVVLPDLSDIIAQLLSRVLRRLHVLPELLQLLTHALVVLSHDTVYLVFILQLLLLLLRLQLLIVRCILEHLL